MSIGSSFLLPCKDLICSQVCTGESRVLRYEEITRDMRILIEDWPGTERWRLGRFHFHFLRCKCKSPCSLSSWFPLSTGHRCQEPEKESLLKLFPFSAHFQSDSVGKRRKVVSLVVHLTEFLTKHDFVKLKFFRRKMNKRQVDGFVWNKNACKCFFFGFLR